MVDSPDRLADQLSTVAVHVARCPFGPKFRSAFVARDYPL